MIFSSVSSCSSWCDISSLFLIISSSPLIFSFSWCNYRKAILQLRTLLPTKTYWKNSSSKAFTTSLRAFESSFTTTSFCCCLLWVCISRTWTLWRRFIFSCNAPENQDVVINHSALIDAVDYTHITVKNNTCIRWSLSHRASVSLDFISFILSSNFNTWVDKMAFSWAKLGR